MTYAEDIKALLKDMASVAMKDTKEYMQKSGNLGGHIIGFDRDGASCMSLPFGWDSTEERSKVLFALKLMLLMKNAVSYVVINEAWAKSFKPNDPKIKEHKWGDLAKEEDKKEVISVMAVFISGESYGMTTEILRDKDNKITGYKDWDDSTHLLDGDLVNLLEPPKKRRPQ